MKLENAWMLDLDDLYKNYLKIVDLLDDIDPKIREPGVAGLTSESQSKIDSSRGLWFNGQRMSKSFLCSEGPSENKPLIKDTVAKALNVSSSDSITKAPHRSKSKAALKRAKENAQVEAVAKAFKEGKLNQ